MGKLIVPKNEIIHAGRYHAKIIRGGLSDFFMLGDEEFEFDNICVNEGLIAMLNSTFAGGSQITNWYIGVYQNNYTPVSTDTASSITGNAGEFTGYSGGARPTFSPASASGSPSLSNSASRASFTFTGSATLQGAFLVSAATPGGSSGTLFSAAQFGSAKSVGNTDQLLLTYTLNASST